jgi:flagellar hook-associated protein 2
VATSAVSSGSGVLDVNGIVSQLMAAEARPLANYDKKTAAVTATVSAYGSLSAAIGVFQSAIGGLTRGTDFKSLSAAVANEAVLTASANAKAVAGSYKVNVTQLAQNQTLSTSGLTAKNTAIGGGGKTTLAFQFGNTSGSFGLTGSPLGNGIFSNGIANGALIINGKAIATGATTTSARALAEAINAQSANSGVTASATPASSAADLFAGFGAVTTDADSTYEIKIGGVTLMSQGSGASGTIDAAALDAVLAGPSAALTALQNAGITFTGSAATEDLVFTRADGANLTVEEVVTGNVGGVQGGLKTGAATNNGGSSVTSGSGIVLNSASGNPISVSGSNPALAGLTAGTGGSYLSGSFSQDGAVASGTVLIDSTNNTLEGIRDAVNKANIGVTATIVSDGSANPYHLVFTSNNSGANGAMKISLTGTDTDPADSALADLLSYDPAGDQKMTQTAAAQDTKLEVNGIAVSSHSNAVSEAIQGVSLTVSQLGSTSVTINKNATALKDSVNGFVKAYNDLSSALKKLTAYDPATKAAGPLQGDATATSIQSQLRRMLSASVTGTGGDLTTLTDIGITFQQDGSLSLDSSKLQKAIDENFAEIGALFGAISNSTDSQVAFVSSTAKTVPGNYALSITQMATQGTVAGDAVVGPSTTIAADTVWAITLNDTVPSNSKNMANVRIPAGTYTPSELAKALQSAINGNAALSKNGAKVSASIDADGKLQIASTKYGSASNIALADVSGSTVAELFGTPASEAGKDVAGTLGGHAVVGSGQSLTGAAGTPVEGLKIDITGGTTGDRGSVNFSQGYAYQLNNLATSILGKGGTIASRTDGLNKSIKDIAKQREKFEDRLGAIEARYRKQYTALDVTLSQMQTTQQYLSQQLAALAANS